MEFDQARARLVAHLGSEISDRRVLKAMSHIPRERFVPPQEQRSAYEDMPLPIGYDQTISQPLIIAMMTQALELRGNEKVLEIGTGSGYQAAILAELAQTVITVERIHPLAEKAKHTLEDLGYKNIEVYSAGETLGYPDRAPYDAIIVTAAAPRVPDELIDQLTIGGRMIIPVGSRYVQELYRIIRGEKKNRVDDLGSCRFVPLIGKNAWEPK